MIKELLICGSIIIIIFSFLVFIIEAPAVSDFYADFCNEGDDLHCWVYEPDPHPDPNESLDKWIYSTYGPVVHCSDSSIMM